LRRWASPGPLRRRSGPPSQPGTPTSASNSTACSRRGRSKTSARSPGTCSTPPGVTPTRRAPGPSPTRSSPPTPTSSRSRRRRSSAPARRLDFGVCTSPTTGSGEGTETVVDLLEAVVSALDERGRSYEVAASSVTTDVSLPADAESGLVDLHLTDRVALLTAADAEVQSTEGGTYDERLRLPVPGTDRTVALERGYCRAALRFDGAAFTAVSTHLESASAPTRRQQAEELLDVLPGDGPVVVGADLNSGPGTTTTAHDTVTASLTDVHAELRPDSEGYTCCQPSSLRNDSSRLASRVDAVLTRDTSGLEAVERLGADPDDRVDATVDGESVAVWPSDHAGVAATVELSAPTATAQPARSDTDTATGTPAGTATPTDTARPTASTTARTEPTSGAGTGFGALAALLGVVAGASVRGRE